MKWIFVVLLIAVSIICICEAKKAKKEETETNKAKAAKSTGDEKQKVAEKTKNKGKQEEKNAKGEKTTDKKKPAEPTKQGKKKAEEAVNKKKGQKVKQDEKVVAKATDKKKQDKTAGGKNEEATPKSKAIKIEKTVVEVIQTEAKKAKAPVAKETVKKGVKGQKQKHHEAPCQQEPHRVTAVVESQSECHQKFEHQNVVAHQRTETIARQPATVESEKLPVVEHPHENDVI